MIIRTSTFGQNKSQLNQLMAQQNKLLEMQMQANSSKKVNTLSDNPQEISTVMNLNAQLSQIASYFKNIDSASNQLNMLDSTFGEVTKKLDRINDLGLGVLNQTGNADTNQAAKAEVDQLLESIVDAANKQYNGEYIFSGAKVDQPPYQITRDADGAITGIEYTGSANGSEGSQKKLEISEGVKMTVNATGDSVFGSYQAGPPEVTNGLFGALGKLSNQLGQDPPNYDDLRVSMNELETGMKSIASTRSEFGAKGSKLTLTKSSLEDLKLSTTSHKSSIVDLDMTEALSNLVQQNYAYQASMSTYMMLQQNSLLNYLQ